MAVDPDTEAQFLVAVKRARELGLSLMEVLDIGGLLLTKKRRHDIEVDSIEDLLRRLQRQAPNKLMAFTFNRTTGTPAEMFDAMVKWVDAVVRARADRKLEDL